MKDKKEIALPIALSIITSVATTYIVIKFIAPILFK